MEDKLTKLDILIMIINLILIIVCLGAGYFGFKDIIKVTLMMNIIDISVITMGIITSFYFIKEYIKKNRD